MVGRLGAEVKGGHKAAAPSAYDQPLVDKLADPGQRSVS